MDFTVTNVRAYMRTVLERRVRQEVSHDGLSRAGVLVPLVFRGREPDLLFTRRTDTVETHKGQISFPGGTMHYNDADTVAAALRETEEEIGVSASYIEPLGLLDDLRTPTGFVITPVVGLLEHLPVLNPNPAEVAEIFFVPFTFFLNPHSGRSEHRQFRGEQWEVWYYDYGDHTIWGVTAAIIRSLVREIEGSAA